MGRRRKKKRAHIANDEQPGKKLPKSFVLSRGKVGPVLRTLERDLRRLMLPNTALRLKESSRNNIKDFLQVAGPLGVTHFMALSTTKESPYLRIMKTPRGPTLTFKIQNYSLAKDVAHSQKRPKSPPAIYSDPPLVVMNNFGQQEDHLKLVTIMFQNMFPAINVNTVKLANCRRVLLLNYNKDTERIDFRHFLITAQPIGVARNIRKLVQKHQVPDLGGLQDVSEFLRSGYGSESEVEEETSRVTLPQDLKGGGNRASNQSAVKLQEIGPRMELQLIKVEAGLCSGDVLFHAYVHKTPEEIAALREQAVKKEALRKQRKAEQEANVKRKMAELEAKKKKRTRENEPWKNKDGEGDAEDNDEEWYRNEVGEDPDEAFMGNRRAAKRGRNERRGAQEGANQGSEDGEDDDRNNAGGEDGRAKQWTGRKTKTMAGRFSGKARHGASSHRLGVRHSDSGFKKSGHSRK
eukprot:TRINITY_DN4367_c0_g1_i6.p1 TRINITY_DN4367_c0_g1~~TRINITY_DN4367_c0_g1_i6.p1  ORF type:complete len:483 (+),score=105.75 TRINITY_DN4367_c0_g1_i6:59-1450(+)